MSDVPVITEVDQVIRVRGDRYAWEWCPVDDRFSLRDAESRVIATGLVQPAVVVSGPDGQRCTSGRVGSYVTDGSRLRIGYDGVNGDGSLIVTWTFDADSLWLEPFRYSSPYTQDVVSLHYFASTDGHATPTLSCGYFVHPGVCQSPAVGPIIPASANLDVTSWLGRKAPEPGGLRQAWGLPAHYFGGFTVNGPPEMAGSTTEGVSAAFCCGLAELPPGDLLFRIKNGCAAPILRLRSDLWGQARHPGELTLGARLYWAIDNDYHAAIRAYYVGLARAGVIKPKRNSEAKNAIIRLPQFNTWGAQVAMDASWEEFDQQALESIYEGLQESGMSPGIFVVDAKWEDTFGLLEHSAERFPRFEEFLDRVRTDGHRVGLWSAFMRCDDPTAVGMRADQMLCGPDGQPIRQPGGYYIFDVSQPQVQEALSERARRFMRRYCPDFVKFDFGYELPSLTTAAPRDRGWAGERLLAHSVDVVVGAMREINPDVVVMYYSLSPLFIDQFDLHGIDDLHLTGGEFHLEANRRLFFSSALGEIGIPSYGSSGYDWLDIEDIWLDSVAIGPLGSLGSFAGVAQDSRLDPGQVAKYNGLSRLVRSTHQFTVEPLAFTKVGVAAGARSSSWARWEDDMPVMVALRPGGFGGAPGCSRFRDEVETDTTAVVASITSAGITKSSHLGVVAWGSGRVTVRHDGRAQTATVTAHGLGGASGVTDSHLIHGGHIRVPVSTHLRDGTPVEWLEIRLS